MIGTLYFKESTVESADINILLDELCTVSFQPCNPTHSVRDFRDQCQSVYVHGSVASCSHHLYVHISSEHRYCSWISIEILLGIVEG